MTINAYAVISAAVEDGIAYGIHRAHKHTETPSRETLETETYNAVMNALCEVLEFGESQ